MADTTSHPARRHAIGVIAGGEFSGVGLCKALSSIFDADVSVIPAASRIPELSLAVIDKGLDAATVEEVRRFRAANSGVAILAVLADPALGSGVAQVPAFAAIRRSAPVRDVEAAVQTLQSAIRTREQGGSDRSKLENLSRRELELLPLLAGGNTLQAAAKKLGITYKTADSYRSNLLRKLGIRDRIELARFAIREGLIQA